MDFQSYSDTALQTASGSMHFNVVNPGIIDAILEQRQIVGPDMDALKKGLFYGKEKKEIADWHEHARPIRADDGFCKNMEADHDIWHGVIGIDTEVCELLEVIRSKEFTKQDIADEAGDLLWYLALLLRGAGLTFDDVAKANIAKLAARFPGGKFNLDNWNNRDKQNEAQQIASIL